MFRILSILALAIIIAVPLVWLLDHNGSVVINWLDYEVRTDMVTAVVITTIFTMVISFFSYLLVRVVTFRFPSLRKKKID